MSLDKAIQHGKEHRKPCRGAKAIDASCRNHGDCPWCKGNRLHGRMKHGDIDLDILGVGSGDYIGLGD